MRAAQPHFEQALSEVGRAHSSMQDQATTLESSWTSDSDGAAPAFIGALNTWLENCEKVRQALQVVTDKLEANTGNYQHVQTNTSDVANHMQQAMSAGLPGF
ncbi:protein of unknown function [Streptantibioticus cattleyicolor NRRL 8057 = DSM 46488]|nr:hypothetical protein [Streptomyces sp. SID5468]CCB73162.1 protein of unknown function [Streptantibioticus cattleyicolor NRRL 8057 = DSM 46488]